MASGGMNVKQLLGSITEVAKEPPQFESGEDLYLASDSDADAFKTDLDDSSDEDGGKKSKRKPKTNQKLDYSVMQATLFGEVDNKNQVLTGKIKTVNPKISVVSNPLDVSGKAVYSISGQKKEFRELRSFTEQKSLRFQPLMVFDGTKPSEYSTQSSYGGGAAARAARRAKGDQFVQVEASTITVYACLDVANAFETVCVNRDQLLNYIHMSSEDFVKKVIVGNLGHTGVITLNEHTAPIAVVSAVVAEYLLLQCTPTVQKYSKYKNPVKATLLRLNQSWEIAIVGKLREIQLALASYTTTSGAYAEQLEKAKAFALAQRSAKEAAQKEVEAAKEETKKATSFLVKLHANLKHKQCSADLRRIVVAMIDQDEATFSKTIAQYSNALKTATAVESRQSAASHDIHPRSSAAAGYVKPKSGAVTPTGTPAPAAAASAAAMETTSE